VKSPAFESIRFATPYPGPRLIVIGGVHGNVLRLQPPLVIRKEELDRAIAVLAEVLAVVAAPKSETPAAARG